MGRQTFRALNAACVLGALFESPAALGEKALPLRKLIAGQQARTGLLLGRSFPDDPPPGRGYDANG
jgi:hypothetical protein